MPQLGWFCYVAFIVDVFAQRIVAWHAATTKTTDLAMIPLRMALWQRGREDRPTQPGQLIHHSDAGSQYTSIRFTEHLDMEGIQPSIGSVGDAYDNALMETIIGLFKAECIRTTVFHTGPYKTLADIEYATAGCQATEHDRAPLQESHHPAEYGRHRNSVTDAGRSCGQSRAPGADTNVGVLSAYVGTE
jgi:transposase InsO family protein